MRAFNEQDLQTVAWIQEARGCTVAKAKDLFRGLVKKLADPDIENRHVVAWENFQRGGKAAEGQEAAPVAKKKAGKKAPKAAKAEKQEKQEVAALPLADLSRDVVLKSLDNGAFYEVKFKNRNVTAIYLDRERDAQRAMAPVDISAGRLAALKKLSKQREQDAVIAIRITVGGRAKQGYIVEPSVGVAHDNYTRFALTDQARGVYANEGWDGCKFEVEQPEKSSEASAA